MNVLVCTASRDQQRWKGFYEQIKPCLQHVKPENLRGVMTVDTKGDLVEIDDYSVIVKADKLGSFFKPTEVMYEKFKAVNKAIENFKYTGKDWTVCMWDDDYAVNPYALKFAAMIMEENPEVTYLSLLRGPGVEDPALIQLSGYNFIRWGSCMGGTVIMRWSEASEHMAEFFESSYRNQPGWDSIYWHFLRDHYGMESPVYMLADFSLVQHCNLVSSYLSQRRGMFDHMYSISFDPRMNPFWFRKE